MRYRIVPLGASSWKVQTLVWWLPFWADLTYDIGYGYSMLTEFSSSEEAEERIRKDIEHRAAVRAQNQRARARRSNIPPREFPVERR